MAQLNELPRQKLREIVAHYGRGISNDPGRCRSLLMDLCGEYRREINLLISVAEEQGAIDLLGASSMPVAMQVVQVTTRLHENRGLAEEFARWGVISWALALGLIAEDVARGLDAQTRGGGSSPAFSFTVASTSGNATPVPPPAPPPASVSQTQPNDRNQFDKFTERARRVLSLSQEEAQRFQHNYIGTEHLLLGLVREGEGVAAKVLSHLGVELNKVRSAVEFIIGRGDHIILGEIGLTPRAKKVIELAVDEARRLNHHYIGTEHLLLGLVREGEGIAAGVLESLGVKLDKVRTQTIQVLSQSGMASSMVLSKTPVLDSIGNDLTSAARAGTLNPIIGRSLDIERLSQTFSRLSKNNPILVGEPGIRKAAIVEGLALRLALGEVPEKLVGLRLVALDADLLITITDNQSEARERWMKIIEELRQSRDCLLFIDEIHLLFRDGPTEIATIFKSALLNGRLRCIGATTPEDYHKYIERDSALQRSFQEVIVRELTVEETIEVLRDVRERYEQHHRVRIADKVLVMAAEMANQYVTNRLMPDKAIDLIDEASSRVRMQSSLAPLNLKDAMKSLETVLREKEQAIHQQEYELAADLRDREVTLRYRIAKLEAGWQRERGNEKLAVREEDLAQVVSMWTGIPVARILGT